MVHLKVRSLCNSRFKLVPDRPWRGILAPMVAAVILIMVLVSRTVAQGPLQPSAFTVLHSFTGPPNDGRNPVTGLRAVRQTEDLLVVLLRARMATSMARRRVALPASYSE